MTEFKHPPAAVTIRSFENEEQFQAARARVAYLWNQPPSPSQEAEIEWLAWAMTEWEAKITSEPEKK